MYGLEARRVTYIASYGMLGIYAYRLGYVDVTRKHKERHLPVVGNYDATMILGHRQSLRYAKDTEKHIPSPQVGVIINGVPAKKHEF